VSERAVGDRVLVIAPIMKDLLDATSLVWSIGSTIYEYRNKNQAEEQMKKLNEFIMILQNHLQ
ncbi:uncharacterized protein DAT39_013284, partial [Clarias magur]